MLSAIAILAKTNRRNKILLQLAVDACLVLSCFALAMMIRLESFQFLSRPYGFSAALVTIPPTLTAFHLLGLYRSLMRHVTASILLIIAQGAFLSALFLYVGGLVTGAGMPRSVPILYALTFFLAVGAVRFVVRDLLRQPRRHARRVAVLYGAGEAGQELLNTLVNSRDFRAVAFVDDDPALHGMLVGGVKVHTPCNLAKIIDETGAEVVLLAMPNITRARRREIISHLEALNIEIKTTPSMSDVISGKAKISELHTITPEDLLGRDPIQPVTSLLEKNVQGKVVLVSGAGGSIGSELCRQILASAPAKLVLLEISEYALYSIEAELAEAAQRMQHAVEIFPVLGSVQNKRRIEDVIGSHKVQTIFHAAAYKHVPLVEENIIEGVRNNIFGTLTMTSAARKLGVESFILISTDKAVRPTNIMGATKRVSELICQAQSTNDGSTVFSMVRFGNVLGSSGSVIPKFRAQIERGGPVTVTHPDITRYFMTIPEASQLVIQAGAMAKGGDVFVLDMGAPVKIMDLAMSMIRLHGLVPYMVDNADEVDMEAGDIPVCVTGLRPGEKLYEELLIGNNPSSTEHPLIMTASEVSLPCSVLRPALDDLLIACENFDVPRIRETLKALPIEYGAVGAQAQETAGKVKIPSKQTRQTSAVPELQN